MIKYKVGDKIKYKRLGGIHRYTTIERVEPYTDHRGVEGARLWGHWHNEDGSNRGDLAHVFSAEISLELLTRRCIMEEEHDHR